MSAVGMMRQTCSIYRPAVSHSSIGSASEAFVRSSSNVRCAIQMNGTSVGIEYQKMTGRRLALGFYPVGTDLHARDRIIWRGVQWEVRGEPINEVSRNSHLVADLEELDGNMVLVDTTGQWDFRLDENSGQALLIWD